MSEIIRLEGIKTAGETIDTLKSILARNEEAHAVSFAHARLFAEVFEFIEYECFGISRICLSLPEIVGHNIAILPEMNICKRVCVELFVDGREFIWSGNNGILMEKILGSLSRATCNIEVRLYGFTAETMAPKAIARVVAGACLRVLEIGIEWGAGMFHDAMLITDAIGRNATIEHLVFSLPSDDNHDVKGLVRRIMNSQSIRKLEFEAPLSEDLAAFILSLGDRVGVLQELNISNFIISKHIDPDTAQDIRPFKSIRRVCLCESIPLNALYAANWIFKQVTSAAAFSSIIDLTLPPVEATDDVLLALTASVPHMPFLEDITVFLDMRKWSGRRFMECLAASPRLGNIAVICTENPPWNPDEDMQRIFFDDLASLITKAAIPMSIDVQYPQILPDPVVWNMSRLYSDNPFIMCLAVGGSLSFISHYRSRDEKVSFDVRATANNIRAAPGYPNLRGIHVKDVDMFSAPDEYPILEKHISDLSDIADLSCLAFTNCRFPR